MEIYLPEKMGNPELFTGRKKELKSLLKTWNNKQKRNYPDESKKNKTPIWH